MISRKMYITIAEGRAIWLALTTFRHNVDDDPILGQTISRIENLFTEDEWTLFYTRRSGKFLVGCNVLGSADDDPGVFDNAEEAIVAMRKEISCFEEIRGVDKTALHFAQTSLQSQDADTLAYGWDYRVDYREGEIRFWIYPDFLSNGSDLHPASESASM